MYRNKEGYKYPNSLCFLHFFLFSLSLHSLLEKNPLFSHMHLHLLRWVEGRTPAVVSVPARLRPAKCGSAAARGVKNNPFFQKKFKPSFPPLFVFDTKNFKRPTYDPISKKQKKLYLLKIGSVVPASVRLDVLRPQICVGV